MEELIHDFMKARISDQEKVMLNYAAKLTIEPWEMVEADVTALRQAGFSDRSILDINQITGYYAYANRLADGLGIEMESYWEDQS